MSKADNFGKAKASFADMTPEQRAEYGRKGGRKSVEVRRRKKEMKEVLNVLLEMPLNGGKLSMVENIKAFKDLKGKNIDVNTAIMVAQVQKALKGDIQAATFIRDTSGQKPQDDVNISGSIPVVISGAEELED